MVLLDFRSSIWRLQQNQIGVHMHHKMGECAVCKAKRLKEESEAEFRERYPLIVLQPNGMMGPLPR
jgi:hypothetical protein